MYVRVCMCSTRANAVIIFCYYLQLITNDHTTSLLATPSQETAPPKTQPPSSNREPPGGHRVKKGKSDNSLLREDLSDSRRWLTQVEIHVTDMDTVMAEEEEKDKRQLPAIARAEKDLIGRHLIVASREEREHSGRYPATEEVQSRGHLAMTETLHPTSVGEQSTGFPATARAEEREDATRGGPVVGEEREEKGPRTRLPALPSREREDKKQQNRGHS